MYECVISFQCRIRPPRKLIDDPKDLGCSTIISSRQYMQISSNHHHHACVGLSFISEASLICHLNAISSTWGRSGVRDSKIIPAVRNVLIAPSSIPCFRQIINFNSSLQHQRLKFSVSTESSSNPSFSFHDVSRHAATLLLSFMSLFLETHICGGGMYEFSWEYPLTIARHIPYLSRQFTCYLTSVHHVEARLRQLLQSSRGRPLRHRTVGKVLLPCLDRAISPSVHSHNLTLFTTLSLSKVEHTVLHFKPWFIYQPPGASLATQKQAQHGGKGLSGGELSGRLNPHREHG